MRTGLTLVKEHNGIKFYGEISSLDIQRVRLDPIDRKLMEECGHSAPAADTILVIEMLFRRMQEQFSKEFEHD